MRHICLIAALVIIAFGPAAWHAHAEDVPATLGAKLVPMAGFESEASYVISLRGELADLIAGVQRTDDPHRKLDVECTIINLILSRQLEPVCAKRFFGIATAADIDGVREVLDQLADRLKRADALFDSIKVEPSRPGLWVDRTARRLRVYRAFADGLRVYLLHDPANGLSAEARLAGAKLSILLEDEATDVVAAATLWQGCLRALAGDSRRALKLLKVALEEPEPATLRYDFFARLLRCVLIAEGGGEAASLALLVQIEERVRDWFPDEADRGDALRAVGLIELRVLRAWRDKLTGDEHAKERQWCVDRATAVMADRFNESQTLLRLERAVPLMTPEG